MTLDPDARRLLDMMRAAKRPPWETLTPEQARADYAASRATLQPAPEEVASVGDLTADGVPVRFYQPAGATDDATLPALVWFHGGGWVLGGLESHDPLCRRLANLARCAVLAVDYRLAPEHKFPAAVDDCVTAIRWASRQARALKIDPARLAVGGDSAGGNLAAVMALMARDGDLPPLAYQVLVYPATDIMMTTPSSRSVGADMPLSSATLRWFIDLYLRGAADASDWHASPLRAATLAGVADAFVLTASADPLRDEGLAYAERLEREGARVTLLHLSDQMHGFLPLGRVIGAAEVALRMIAIALGNRFNRFPLPRAEGV